MLNGLTEYHCEHQKPTFHVAAAEFPLIKPDLCAHLTGARPGKRNHLRFFSISALPPLVPLKAAHSKIVAALGLIAFRVWRTKTKISVAALDVLYAGLLVWRFRSLCKFLTHS